ncbi:MAG: hypothetical protein ACXWF2_12250 [Usitatibacter sp.]
MKTIALIAGLLFLGLGIAGFAGLIAIPQMYAIVLAGAGAIFLMYGFSHRRELTPMRGTGNDMRDLV